MKINWSQVYEGWRNKLIPPSNLRELIEKTAEERIEICRTCKWNSSNLENYKTIRMDEHCTKCGCTLSAKARCLSCRCPLRPPKWDVVLSREKEEEIINSDEIRDT